MVHISFCASVSDLVVRGITLESNFWMKLMELVAEVVLKVNIESMFIPLHIKMEKDTMLSIGNISSSRFRLAINPPVLLIIANQSGISVLVII
jgi:hypothetical protein